MRNKHGFKQLILIAEVQLSGAVVNGCKKKANKRKRSTWTRRREKIRSISAR